MEYKPLNQFNPTGEDVTANSSAFFSARGLMPARGSDPEMVCCPHFQLVHGDMPMRVMRNDALLHIDGLAGLSNGNEVIELEPKNLSWSGIWQADGQAAIGHADEGMGLTAPFGTFNMGYRYKQGWRPQYVD